MAGAYTGSKAKTGRGTVVSIGGVSGGSGTETFIKVSEVLDSSFGSSAWGTEDSSNFDSGVDEEFLATMRNNGEVNLKYNVVDSDPGQQALNTACDSGQKYDFTVQLKPGPGQTTGTLYAFSALILTVLEIPITTKGIIQNSSKLKISGSITKTFGS